MKKTVLSIAALTVLAFAACKKDDNKKSNEQLILGKWHPKSSHWTVKDAIADTTHVYDSPGNLTNVSDFRSDGKIYTSTTNSIEHDTIPYKIIQDKLIVDGDTSTITTLTSTQLIFSTHVEYSGGRWVEDDVDTFIR